MSSSIRTPLLRLYSHLYGNMGLQLHSPRDNKLNFIQNLLINCITVYCLLFTDPYLFALTSTNQNDKPLLQILVNFNTSISIVFFNQLPSAIYYFFYGKLIFQLLDTLSLQQIPRKARSNSTSIFIKSLFFITIYFFALHGYIFYVYAFMDVFLLTLLLNSFTMYFIFLNTNKNQFS